MNKKIGIIGLGKMGSAFAELLVNKDYSVYGFDINIENLNSNLKTKIKITKSIEEIASMDIPLILAIKPNHVQEVCSKIINHNIIISIVAGVSIKKIEQYLPNKNDIVRTMPNTPLQIGKGVIGVYANKNIPQEKLSYVIELLKTGGEVVVVNYEDDLNTVTGLSGSGPAFVYTFLQALEDAGVLQGLSRAQSRVLAIETVLGATELVKQSGRSPQDLIHDVTSPGGTTITGLVKLKEATNFDMAIINAVTFATKRSKELDN